MPCPACDRAGPGEEYETLPGARILACSACGLGRTDPVPAAALEPVSHYAGLPADEARRRLPLTRGYARPLVSYLERRRPTGRLLEIGSGVGGLLSVAREHGYQVEGIELNPGAVAFTRSELGLTIHAGTFEAASLPEAGYDLVVANHVFEHLVDILSALRKVLSLLRPGGIFLLVSPHYLGWIARWQRRAWYGWQKGEHVWHLTRESAARLLSRAGFAGVETSAAVNMDHPIHPGIKAPAKAAVLGLAGLLGHADQVFASGSRPL